MINFSFILVIALAFSPIIIAVIAYRGKVF